MNLVRQGPKKLILYQQVQKHHGAVYSLDFTSKSNDLRLFGPMEHWLKMLWASRKMQPASLPYNATNLLTVFGPPFFGNASRHAYLKFMLLTFYSHPTTTDTIFKSICISKTFCSFAGSGYRPGWTFDSTDSHGSEASRWGWDLQTSTGVDVQLGCSLNHPWCSTIFYLHLNWGKVKPGFTTYRRSQVGVHITHCLGSFLYIHVYTSYLGLVIPLKNKWWW